MKILNDISNNLDVIKYLFNLKKTNEIQRLGKLFNTELNNYFYDTGTGKVILLDDGTFMILNTLFNEEDKSSFENFEASLNENKQKSIDELVDIIKSENLLQAIKMKKLYSFNHFENLENVVNHGLHQIILELTGRCNLRCRYCIYNDSYEGNRNFNQEDMTQEVAKAAIDYAKEHSGDKVAVTFYGGEPLLKFDLLKWSIEYSKKVLSDKDLSFSLTTNLTLVTKEIAEYLASIDGLSVLCSLDGPENIQNSYRQYVNGTGTFKEAIRGLKYLVDAFKGKKHNKISINGVFAPPYTFEKLDEINSFFKNLEWLPKDISINLDYASNGSVSDAEHLKELRNNPKYRPNGRKSINPLFDWRKRDFEKNSKSKNEISISNSNIKKNLLRIHARHISNAPVDKYSFNACCVPGSRRLYISTKGDLYVCEKIGLSPSIGNIFDGINFDRLKKYYIDDYSKYSTEQCSKCWAVRLCGMCYTTGYTKDGLDINKKNRTCNSEKVFIENSLCLYHSLLENTPEKLDCLNEMKMY